MIIGKVIGNLVATQKHYSYQNKKLLLVKPIDLQDRKEKDVIIAVDTVDAGVGDKVLVMSEGNSTTEELGFERRQPLRSIVIAVIDHIEHHNASG
ncbi:MAG: EutN/CcmL family microcompartment protein [Calditrichaeota bacterium]|nr:EutN/CcmL family microcompartment protein [Calditrichota bacterium]